MAFDSIVANHVSKYLPVDTMVVLAAAEFCSKYKLATADAIVYATAVEHSADLLTCDAHFDGLPGVTFIAKINA